MRDRLTRLVAAGSFISFVMLARRILRDEVVPGSLARSVARNGLGTWDPFILSLSRDLYGLVVVTEAVAVGIGLALLADLLLTLYRHRDRLPTGGLARE
jgi:hypothetical protein